ncbi:disease resistance protein At4g27190-like isoform X3 [Prunus avium]|uniref:Disease resistance protein At4g27190-like isoform X2 n=1 Tax=Prunus avium TaxID=42229 RepID=A0A6P5TEI5_PRUAV|nr:disease resistance protein At4g27190-like isoform X2 [Prunus avium]XP_021825576.1 disease resistance protein At4g27190-like isoform X2 [Prunus avium]XP_021825577.1 disease resistance protein At4g27190-like isoform X3 [Prunus avium]
MEILTVIIPEVVGKVIEYTVVPVGRQVGYLIHYKSNRQNLRRQLKNLNAAKERLKHTVFEVERKGKGIHDDVQNWSREADEITQEAETFLDDVGQVRTKCVHGICPNLVSYHQLSRKSTKLIKKIELHEKIEFPSVSYNAPAEEIFATPSEDYMAFESRNSMVKKILEELRNPGTNLLGVYGTGGVGKSTLVQEVYRQAKKENLFDDVVIVLDAKQYPEAEKKERIQKKIAEKLDMDVQESQDIEGRAKTLWNRIKDKNIFVILDDVWEAIKLEALGLRPMATCKILLTSRDRVFEMRTQKEFRLEVLGMEENWSLFEKIVGDVVEDDRIRKVATKVAKKCGGLPVLVVAVASALRSENTLEVWKDALRRFKSRLAKPAYLALEWSYNRLDGEELKPLFLLCGIIAGGSCSISLSDLLKYIMGLGLVKNVDRVEEARDTLLSLVKKLKDSCLLLESYDDGRVRMHELVRDVAIWIACRDQHALSRAYGDELTEWPHRDFLKKCSAISLNYCKIPKLPEVPWVCPELRFFKLVNHNNDDSLEITGNYFEGMNELKVVDVTGLRIPSLPPSLQSLTILQTLCLDQCVLGDIALVGQLTNLKILSLIHSHVKELPKQIGQLTCLQLLDLTGCSELVLISPGVISSLTRLEDLRMGINSFKQWEGEGFIDGRRNASIIELKHLSQLTALEIHIPDAKILPANLFSDKLERYTILVGDWPSPHTNDTSSNVLKLKLATRNQFDRGIKSLLKKCEDLSLDGMEAVNIISYLLDSGSAKQLKRLHVQNNDEVISIINSVSWSYSRNAFPIAEPFPKLGSLTLRNLPKLIGFSSEDKSRSIVTTRTHKQLTIDTEAEEIILENEIGGPTKLFLNGEVLMGHLTTLILHQCDGLRFLFSFSMARSLVQLKHLKISHCQIMEEIVTKIDCSEENTDNIFCKLKHLQLQYLPSLVRFCSGSYIEFPLLELLHLEDCTKMGTFIFDSKSESVTIGKQTEERDLKENVETDVQYFILDQKVGFPSLEILIIHDQPKLLGIWHSQLAPNSFCRLRKVKVFRCHSLTNIFAPSMIGRLNALDTLEIRHCQSLQVVFEQAYYTSTTELKTFECPSLDLIRIDSCQSLKNIFPASVATALQHLRELHVENCGTLKEIVAEDGLEATPTFVFPKLTYAIFQKLPQLRSFYFELHVSKWPLLKELVFLECGNVEIFAFEFSRFREKLELGLHAPIKQPFFLLDKASITQSQPESHSSQNSGDM